MLDPPNKKHVMAMLMSLRTTLGFSESPSSSPRNTSADNSPATTEYLKMARKGGGRKGMVCFPSTEPSHRNR